MDELSITLLDRLIEKTFENMTQDERMAFFERLFADMSLESQERFLRRMMQAMPYDGAERTTFGTPMMQGWPGPPFMRWAMEDYSPRDIGPWRTCCRMMAEVDRARQVETMDATRPARVFGALADETRIKIVKLLSEGEKNVDEIAQHLGTPQSTISHHLRVLKEAELVQSEKRGRSVYYSIVPSFMELGSEEQDLETKS